MMKKITLADIILLLLLVALTAFIFFNRYFNSDVYKLNSSYLKIKKAYKKAIKAKGPLGPEQLIAENSGEGANNIYEFISPYLKITKTCGMSSECIGSMPDGYSNINKTIQGVDKYDHNSSFYGGKTILKNGALVVFKVFSPNCQTDNQDCGHFFIDINGIEPPNQEGYDLFQFSLVKDDIYPLGYGYPMSEFCSVKSGHAWACAAWVVYKKNMDYLKCDDLNWNGKTRCSRNGF